MTPAAARRNLLLILAITVATTTSRGALELTLPLNLYRLGLPLPVIGTTLAVFGLAALVSRLPAGAWYRLSRARRLAIAALAAMNLAILGLGFADALFAQAGLVAVAGFSFGLATTIMLALLIELRPRHENPGPTMAWYTAAISTGYALGPSLAAAAIQRLGFSSAFIVSGLVGLAGVALLPALKVPRVETRSLPTAWNRLTSLPLEVWLATLLVFYINFAGDALGTFFPILAVQTGIAVAFVGLLKSAIAVAATGVRFAATVLLARVGADLANHLSVVATALAVLATTATTDHILLLLAFALIGGARGMIRATSATMVAREWQRDPAGIGLASGVYNAGLDLGTMLGPPAGGVLAGLVGIPNMLRLVGLVLPLAYYGLWIAARTQHLKAVSAGT